MKLNFAFELLHPTLHPTYHGWT